MKKKLNILFLFTLISFFYISASSHKDWKTYLENENIKIEYTYEICDFSSTASQELVVFRFTNLKSQKIQVSYDVKIWNDSCLNCEQDSEEFRKNIYLKENEIFYSDGCKAETKDYNIFSGFVHNESFEKYTSLTKFELKNLRANNE